MVFFYSMAAKFAIDTIPSAQRAAPGMSTMRGAHLAVCANLLPVSADCVLKRTHVCRRFLPHDHDQLLNTAMGDPGRASRMRGTCFASAAACEASWMLSDCRPSLRWM